MKFTPDIIASLITEDMTFPSENMALLETVGGITVLDGDTPMDDFLKYVEFNYLGWDLNNKKWQAAAQRFFGNIPTKDGLLELIDQSSQSEELKIILRMWTEKAPVAEPINPLPMSGKSLKLPVKRGDRVRLGKHKKECRCPAGPKCQNASANWSPSMDQYVGKVAVVIDETGQDAQQCDIVNVDIDQRQHQWRTNVMTQP